MMTVSLVNMDFGSELERLGLGLWGIFLGEVFLLKEVSIWEDGIVFFSLFY